MKTRLRGVALLCVLLAVAALAAVAVGATARPAAQGPPDAAGAAAADGSDATAADVAAATAARQQCNFVLAGKGATADGSVMMTYNNDWSPYNAPYFEVVPATETTYGFVKILCIGDIEEGGINEHQFAVNYGTATGLDPAVLAADPYEAQGITGEFWDLLLQKCATCDEALDLIAEIAETRGFNSGCAGSLGFADTNGAWCFELLGGHHWVAQRVPDDAILAHPNTIVVRQIDLSDPDNFRGSPDLEEFAQSIGRYDPAEGPFDVAWAYSDRERLLTYYNTNRIWGAFNSVAPSLGLVPEMPYETRPVWVVPDEPVTRQDIMAISRYHYEGTELDQTEDYTLMSPHKQTNRPICDRTTDYSAVWQLRDWLPAEVGGVLWVAPGRPCASAYTPFYAGITSVPEKWADRTAARAFCKVALRLDRRGTIAGESYYAHYIPLVHGVFGTFEAEVEAEQAAVEATALGLEGAERQDYLTTYSAERAQRAYELALSLPSQIVPPGPRHRVNISRVAAL
ncbi:MAG TPA: C69 family dipeptidase [Thermoleophilia bacterium]|nr:C69 family dipeptidase [Thermoleophilia bacterium]